MYLILMLAGGVFCWRTSYLLARGRLFRVKNMYKKRGVPEHTIEPLNKSYAVLLLIGGSWLFLLPFCIVLFRIPFSSWTALLLVFVCLHLLGELIINRKHGHSAS